MKQLTITLLMLLASMAAFAKSEIAPLLQAFDGRYNNSKGVEITMVEQSNNYYNSIEVKNNPAVAQQIVKWFNEVRAKAHSVSTSISDGEQDIILNLENHVNVGLTTNSDKGKLDLWIHSPQPLK